MAGQDGQSAYTWMDEVLLVVQWNNGVVDLISIYNLLATYNIDNVDSITYTISIDIYRQLYTMWLRYNLYYAFVLSIVTSFKYT